MQAPLTTHARVRMQQRGIPDGAIDLLLDSWASPAAIRECVKLDPGP